MKTFKEFETIVAAKSKQELFSAKEKTARGTYKMGIDYYDNLCSNANYFVAITFNGKLEEWYCFHTYEMAMATIIGWLK